MSSGVYRVEISSNNRAGCKNKECKDSGTKILKGEVRFGTYVTIQEHQSWQWKHWGCVTPKQLSNVKDSIDDDTANLDGYEDLPADLQAKIDKAVEEGHVADEDWNGDVEMNRVGKNGFRTTATKKARKEEAKASEEGATTPNQTPVKKRGRVKEDPDAKDTQDNGPPAKKKRTNVKKEKKIKNEPTDEASGVKAQPIAKARTKSSTAVSKVEPTVKEEDGDDAAMDPPPVKRARAPRKSRTAKKDIDKNIEADTSNVESEDGKPLPARKMRLPRRAAAKTKIVDEETENEALSESQESRGKSPTSSHNAAAPGSTLVTSKKAKVVPKKASHETIDNMEGGTNGTSVGNRHQGLDGAASEISSDGSEEAPKAKKGRKRAAKRHTKGKPKTG